MPRVIPPVVEVDDAFFWEGVARRELLLRRCATCFAFSHPPVPMCHRCHGVDWVSTPASGRGRVHTWIVSRHPTEDDDAPRVVILVELEEGVRFVSNLQGVAVEDVRNDMAVELTFMEVDGVLLPQFVAASMEPRS